MHGPRDANTDSNEEHEKKLKKGALLTHAEKSDKLQMLSMHVTKIYIAIFITTLIIYLLYYTNTANTATTTQTLFPLTEMSFAE